MLSKNILAEVIPTNTWKVPHWGVLIAEENVCRFETWGRKVLVEALGYPKKYLVFTCLHRMNVDNVDVIIVGGKELSVSHVGGYR